MLLLHTGWLKFTNDFFYGVLYGGYAPSGPFCPNDPLVREEIELLDKRWIG